MLLPKVCVLLLVGWLVDFACIKQALSWRSFINFVVVVVLGCFFFVLLCLGFVCVCVFFFLRGCTLKQNLGFISGSSPNYVGLLPLRDCGFFFFFFL